MENERSLYESHMPDSFFPRKKKEKDKHFQAVTSTNGLRRVTFISIPESLTRKKERCDISPSSEALTSYELQTAFLVD
jgi:hypothetical protein